MPVHRGNYCHVSYYVVFNCVAAQGSPSITPACVYDWVVRFEKEEPLHSPRLFECSNQTGRFVMAEVQDFAQDDLDEDDVMLLDTWEEVRG